MPRYVWGVLAVAVISFLLSVVAVLRIVDLADAQAQAECARAVSIRDDNRAMWLYVVDTYTGEDNGAQMEAFETELNRLLPPLKCVDGAAVPDD